MDINAYKRLSTDLPLTDSFTLLLSKRKSGDEKNNVKLKFYNHAKS